VRREHDPHRGHELDEREECDPDVHGTLGATRLVLDATAVVARYGGPALRPNRILIRRSGSVIAGAVRTPQPDARRRQAS
jgi:hypothetical protein